MLGHCRGTHTLCPGTKASPFRTAGEDSSTLGRCLWRQFDLAVTIGADDDADRQIDDLAASDEGPEFADPARLAQDITRCPHARLPLALLRPCQSHLEWA